jgi:predicted DCC family thiol-disulfide oxidoreductase YuxK
MADFPLTLLYDGGCPICRFEMDRLREQDSLQRLAFVDIAAIGFEPRDWCDGQATLDDMRRVIHAVRPDRELLLGVDAVVAAYQAVGWGHWTWPARMPFLKPVADRGYAIFARHRYRVSRWVMPWLAPFWARRAARRMNACADGTCPLPPSHPRGGDA